MQDIIQQQCMHNRSAPCCSGSASTIWVPVACMRGAGVHLHSSGVSSTTGVPQARALPSPDFSRPSIQAVKAAAAPPAKALSICGCISLEPLHLVFNTRPMMYSGATPGHMEMGWISTARGDGRLSGARRTALQMQAGGQNFTWQPRMPQRPVQPARLQADAFRASSVKAADLCASAFLGLQLGRLWRWCHQHHRDDVSWLPPLSCLHSRLSLMLLHVCICASS